MLQKIIISKPGITPACAGKRYTHLNQSGCLQDHPRVCGEKSLSRTIAQAKIGSPPRVRGKDNSVDTCYHEIRITPACAGKSYCQRACWHILQDHPRVCGEKHRYYKYYGHMIGSPPRVRGKAARTLNCLSPWQDHPRVCGEKSIIC